MMKDRNEQQHHSPSETRMQDLSHAVISILDNILWPAMLLFWLCTLEASTTLLFLPCSQCINTSVQQLDRVGRFGTKTPKGNAGSALSPWQPSTCSAIMPGPFLVLSPGSSAPNILQSSVSLHEAFQILLQKQYHLPPAVHSLPTSGCNLHPACSSPNPQLLATLLQYRASRGRSKQAFLRVPQTNHHVASRTRQKTRYQYTFFCLHFLSDLKTSLSCGISSSIQLPSTPLCDWPYSFPLLWNCDHPTSPLLAKPSWNPSKTFRSSKCYKIPTWSSQPVELFFISILSFALRSNCRDLFSQEQSIWTKK